MSGNQKGGWSYFYAETGPQQQQQHLNTNNTFRFSHLKEFILITHQEKDWKWYQMVNRTRVAFVSCLFIFLVHVWGGLQ